MNVQETARRLKKSEPTVRRWIRDGKLEATRVDGIYDIPESAVNERSTSGQVSEDERQGELAAMRAHIQSLERQVVEKDKLIESLQMQLAETAQRHDIVVMQMSKMLEFERQPFWRRWLRQKSLPAPVADADVMDATPADGTDGTDDTGS